MPKYNGVDVDHPDVIRGIKNLVKRRKPDGSPSTFEIMKIIGMPYEVVRKYEREAEKEKSR